MKTFKITDDANSDGGGLATINISPAIYVGSEPADSAAITVSGVNLNATIDEIIFDTGEIPIGRRPGRPEIQNGHISRPARRWKCLTPGGDYR